jgi:hypothetical protein
LFEGERLARYERIPDAVLANNDILDQRSDLIDLLPELHDEWRRLKRTRYEGLNMPTSELTDLLINSCRLSRSFRAGIGDLLRT